jgi:capsular exopolysaccharide synthesis family protein
MAANPNPNPNPAEEGDQTFEWSEVLHAWIFRARIFLKRYWWIFLLTVAGGVGLQAYKEYHRVPLYDSSASLILRGHIFTQQGANYVDESANFFPTKILLLTSGPVQSRARAVVQALHPQEFGPPAPDVNINAGQVGTTDVISLAAVGTNPLYTQYYLDAVIQAFFDYQKDQREEAAKESYDQNMEKVLDYEQQIKDLEASKLIFQQKNNIVSVEQQSQVAGAEEARLESEKASIQTQLGNLESANLNDYIAGKNVEDVDQLLLGPQGVEPEDADYQQAKQELRRLDAERDSFASVLRPAHPKMIALSQAIDNLNNSLQMQRRQIVTLLNERHSALVAELARLEAEVQQSQGRALAFSTLAGQYDQIISQLDQAKKTHEQLLEIKASVKDLGTGTDQEMLAVMEPASPAVKEVVYPAKQIVMGAFTGLVAGAALIFLLGLLDGRVMSVEDVTQRFDEPMLGIIPMQRRVSGQVALLQSNDQRLMFSESCRNIRSSLLYMDHLGQRPRMIVITSSIPGEGKSTISANLAITLGFASSRTLLVDADLRRGQLYKRFGLKNDVGLAEHIQDGLPIEQVIQATGFENLDLIASGQYPAHPGELLMSERFRETMAVLKKKYDFVVFDSPPIMATDDAASFATRTDAVLFVVRAGHTRLRQIRASLESLRRRGVRIYGLVVNFIDHREPGYYSYKYYDYYSYRTPEKK